MDCFIDIVMIEFPEQNNTYVDKGSLNFICL